MKKLRLLILTLGLLLIAGPAWGAGVHYTGLTPADSRCSFASNDSWLAWNGLDFSEFALPGKYFVRLTDGSDLVAEGIAGVVGTGETLGSEMLLGAWTNSGGAPFDTLTTTGDDIDSAIASVSSQCYQQYGSDVFMLGQSYRYTATLAGADLTTITNIAFRDSGTGGDLSPFYTALSTAGALDAYAVLRIDSRAFWIRAVGVNFSLNHGYLKQVTEPPGTAIHILNGPGGSEAWAKIENGFEPYDIVEVEILPAATLAGVTLNGTGMNLP